MKKHNTIKVVLITILVLMLLTWILPAAYYSSGYVDQGRVQMGLFDLFNYPITALSYFGYIAVFILVVGAFYGLLNKISAYRNLLDKLATTFKKKGNLVLAIIMAVLAVVTSICGLQIGLFIFFPMLVSLILLMGYDKIVAALTLVGSTMIGVAGSTFAYNNTSIVMSTLGLKIDSLMLGKIIILVVGLALLIVNTFLYIKNKGSKDVVKVVKKETLQEEETVPVKEVKTVKASSNVKSKDKSKSKGKAKKKDTHAAVKDADVIVVKEDDVESDEQQFIPTRGTEKHSLVPLIVVFALMFVIMVLSFVQWSGAFKNTAFDSATKAVTGFKLFGFAIFGKLLGNVNAFGSWNLTELLTMVMIAGLVLALIYKVKFDDVIDGAIDGVKRAFGPALITILIYTCLVTVTYHPFQLVIYKFILGWTKSFNVFTGSIVAILASAFNSNSAYAFQSVLPYLASVYTKSTVYPVIGVAFQSMYGLTMLIAPTSVVLMSVLSYLGISYSKWFKTIWKLLVELFVIFLVILAILMLV